MGTGTSISLRFPYLVQIAAIVRTLGLSTKITTQLPQRVCRLTEDRMPGKSALHEFSLERIGQDIRTGIRSSGSGEQTSLKKIT